MQHNNEQICNLKNPFISKKYCKTRGCFISFPFRFILFLAGERSSVKRRAVVNPAGVNLFLIFTEMS